MNIKINLIPQNKKDKLKNRSNISFILKVGAYLTTVIVIFFIFLLIINKIMNLQLAAVENDFKTTADQSKIEQVKKFDSEFNRINKDNSAALKIFSDELYWSQVLHELSFMTPEGVELSNVSSKDYALFISGISINRDKLIEFRDSLSSSQCFSDINLPLSNLIIKENISFQIDLIVKKECLKKK